MRCSLLITGGRAWKVELGRSREMRKGFIAGLLAFVLFAVLGAAAAAACLYYPFRSCCCCCFVLGFWFNAFDLNTQRKPSLGRFQSAPVGLQCFI